MQQPPWFVRAFSSDSALVYAHRNDDLARREARFLAEVLRLQSGSRCLDIACGTGRHLRALADSGAQLIGVDLSRDLLAHAAGCRVARADMRRLPFHDGAFTAAYSAFSSFGYFESPKADLAALREAARILAPGGRFVLDLADAEHVRSALKPVTVRQAGALQIREERRLESDLVIKLVHIDSPGHSTEWEERLRLYSPQQARTALEAAGFTPLSVHAGMDGGEDAHGARHVHLAERRHAG